jgi:hypothetical protein
VGQEGPGDLLPPIALQERVSTSVPPTRSVIGTAIIILAAAFLILTLNEGRPVRYQPVIDSLFHTWPVTAFVALLVWLIRREAFGPLRSRFVRGLSGVVATYFALTSSVALAVSQSLWNILKPFGIVQIDVEPAVVFVVTGLWGFAFIVLLARAVFRWFRKRYQHHGFAVGFGPFYFYFRRRRTS